MRVSLAGDLPKINVAARPKITRREDGSYLIDAFVPLSDVVRLIGASEAPPGDHTTLAAFVLAQLHELPKSGDHFVWAGWQFEVVDMDGRRIDVILAQRQPEHSNSRVAPLPSRLGPPGGGGFERRVLALAHALQGANGQKLGNSRNFFREKHGGVKLFEVALSIELQRSGVVLRDLQDDVSAAPQLGQVLNLLQYERAKAAPL